MLVGHRPGIEEQQFHVEHQKRDRHQVKAHVEPSPGVVDRVHAAFVRHLLDRAIASGADQTPHQDQHRSHPPSDHQEEQDGGSKGDMQRLFVEN